MMKGLLCVLLFTVLISFNCLPSFANTTFTWLGTTSDWNSSGNWSGGSTGHLVPNSSTDDVIIKPVLQLLVTLPPAYYPVIKSNETITCGNITFQNLAAASITVQGVLNAGVIQQNHNTGAGDLSATITGTGTINCSAINVGDGAVPALLALTNKNITTVKCNITRLFVTNLITVASASSSSLSKTNNAVFNIDNDNGACTVTAGGINVTNNTPITTASSSFSILNSNVATVALKLKLTGATPVTIGNSTYSKIDFYTGSANSNSTVEYAGNVRQTVCTDNTPGLDQTPTIYQHIAFSGDSTKIIDQGNLYIPGDWTSSGGKVDGVTNNPSVVFSGTGAQALKDNGAGGTYFKNVTFQANGKKTISGGAAGMFYVTAKGLLTMAGATELAVTGSKLTLVSDNSGTATVAAIPSGCSITGNVNVQRYFNAGSAAVARNYRLLSSPVYNGINGGAPYGTLSYLSNGSGLFTGGYMGPDNGFTVANNNPTVYLYKENLPASNTGFNTGNFKGLANIASDPMVVYNDAGGSPNVNATLYSGNGYMLYYVGNNTDNLTNKQTRINGKFADPDATTATATGTLNQGPVTVKLWWKNSTALSKRQVGYNLVGNPYASTIDWDKFSSTNSNAAIYGPGLSSTIYIFNFYSKNYSTYQANVTSNNGGSNLIASGQGFFVLVTDTTQAKLVFNESAKTSAQPSGLTLFMGLPAQVAQQKQILHIKLTKDSINTDETALVFEDAAQNTFEAGTDAPRLNGIGNIATLATYASGSTQQLAINHLHSIDSATRVKLYVNSTGATAINTLSVTGFNSLDPRYDAFLIDHYKNDSLQISLYGKYDFNLQPDNAATYGDKRFELVFHKKGGLNYRLLSLTGNSLKTQIELKWKVEAESNFTSFTLERADATGNYLPLYSMQSNGSGNYTWIDQSPLNGTNYYRLKQIDAFDHTTYSNVVIDLNPTTDANQPVMVYPNPVVGAQFNLQVTLPVIPSQMLLRVIGLNGQVFINRLWTGYSTQQGVNNLLPGTYIVEVSDYGTKKILGRVKINKP